MAKHFLIVLYFCAALNYACKSGCSQSWKTGSSFRKALNQKTKFLSNGGLKDGLEGLSRNSRVAIFLDRDIDPDQRLDFPSQLQPLGKTLDEVAESANALALSIGSFVYIVPREKALRFLIVQNIQASQLTRYSTTLKERLSDVTEVQWPLLASPRDLITVMTANLQLKIANSQMIPHDLWSANNLPRLAKWEQLTWLLACMNLTFVIDEATKSIKVMQLGDEQILTLKFRRSEQRRIDQAIQQQDLKQIKTVLRGSDYFVRGSLRELVGLFEKIRPVRKWSTNSKVGSQDVFDLKTSASRGSILATIAKNRGVQLRFGAEANNVLREKVSVNVKDVSIEELIETTLKGSGLRFRLTDDELQITK